MSNEDKYKNLKITAETSNKGREIEQFMPLVQMIARKESQSKSKQIMSFEEMINSGLISVNKLIETAKRNPGTEYNSSYIAQSIKWAIKDEIRSRQSWYGVKKVVALDPESIDAKPKEENNSDPTIIKNISTAEDMRAAVFEVIMSVESMEEDVGFVPGDESHQDHLDRLELLGIKTSLQKAVAKLPENLRQVIELRYYKALSGNEVAEKIGVTPSRISHMIREAVNKLRVLMVAEGYSGL